MAEKVTFKLAAAAAEYVRKDAPRENRLQAARGDVAVSAADLMTVLFFLAHDPDPEVKNTALTSLRNLREPQILAVAGSPDTHPKILDMLARLHYSKKSVAEILASNSQLEEETRAFLKEKVDVGAREASQQSAPRASETEAEDAAPLEDMDEVDECDENDECEDVSEDDEADDEIDPLASKYQLSMKMEIPEKVKMALIGDKEWRTLMLKDTNNMVCLSVLKNPRITEPEILAVINSSSLNEEMMRIICGNKDWMKNYQIRRAVVLNCKTPLHTAIRLLTTLNDKDLAALAKSRDVSTVLRQQARKFFLNKKDRESGIV